MFCIHVKSFMESRKFRVEALKDSDGYRTPLIATPQSDQYPSIAASVKAEKYSKTIISST